MARRIDFFDGAESETTPVIGNLVASNLITYANDAAYEAGEDGAPAEGNIYFNTTLNLIRYYTGAAWISLVDESSAQTIQNKTIDGTDATGNNTVSIDATDASYDNATSSLVATDVQAAIDEVEGRVDAVEADVADLVTLSGVAANSTDLGTFTGTIIPDSSDNKEALQALETQVDTNTSAISANTTDIANLQTLSGMPDGSTHLGTFTGVTIPDSSTIKAALQALETTLEGITDALDFQGVWNANTNSPALASSTGTKGHFYIVDTAGSTNLDGISSWAVGDWAVFDGTVWRKIDNTDAVTSVNSQTGAVVLDADDISDSGTTNKWANGSIDTHSDVDTSSTPPTDGQVLTWVSGNNAWEPADATGGAGTSGINYITNSQFESGISDWVAYDDGAVAAPVDGTGGSPTNSLTHNTVAASVLRGTGSLQYDISTGDQQGEGFSTDFSIENSDKLRLLQVSFDYYNTGRGDLRVYVYDVTGASLIGVVNDPNGGYLENTTTAYKTFSGTFTATSSSDYRLIVHITTTASVGISPRFDNFRVGSPEDISPVVDSQFRILDNADPTKQVAFEASGLTTATTRTLTVPDASGTLPLLGSTQTFSGVNTFSNSTASTSKTTGAVVVTGGVGVGGTVYSNKSRALIDTNAQIEMGTVNNTSAWASYVGIPANTSITLGNGLKVDLTMGGYGALVMCRDGGGTATLFAISYSSATIIEIMDIAGGWALTDAGASWRIFKSAGSQTFSIRNSTGVSQSLEIVVMGTTLTSITNPA